ncbi:transmembrane protein 222 isoform X2 [Neoarius graeffei]|uniref:transmembrane protein 222 isoform X2 n=1 Tax=Neoarius graeffei TaxID=443677 RepID=UPI00298C88B0|nr:transmembrane protein 222 isoform X2 [Neoarius graeffei]
MSTVLLQSHHQSSWRKVHFLRNRERQMLCSHLYRWLFPFIGHMGICTSEGVIRDFAGPYFVSEDNMAFGRPTKYWMLDVSKVYANGSNAWDTAVHDASEEYKHRMHNLCCDNCHSHVAMALNLMHYDNSTSWNMVNLCLLALINGKHVRALQEHQKSRRKDQRNKSRENWRKDRMHPRKEHYIPLQ